MNKKLMIPLLGVFAVSLIVAGGLVINTLTLNVGVAEPFTVQYAVLGDSGDYNVGEDGTCTETSAWFSSGDSSVPGGVIYPEETRKFCVKINNVGESPIDYSVTSKIKEGIGNYADCAVAFPETTISGTANNGETITGQEFTVPGNAPVVGGCEIEISVARG